MSAMHVLYFAAAGLVSVGLISVQQAAYFDGDDQAHTRSLLPSFHRPKHPYAKRAFARGLVLTLSGAALTAGLLLAR